MNEKLEKLKKQVKTDDVLACVVYFIPLALSMYIKSEEGILLIGEIPIAYYAMNILGILLALIIASHYSNKISEKYENRFAVFFASFSFFPIVVGLIIPHIFILI